jgi:hypothetical protein
MLLQCLLDCFANSKIKQGYVIFIVNYWLSLIKQYKTFMQIVSPFFVVLFTSTLNLLKSRRPIHEHICRLIFGTTTLGIHNLCSFFIFLTCFSIESHLRNIFFSLHQLLSNCQQHIQTQFQPKEFL